MREEFYKEYVSDYGMTFSQYCHWVPLEECVLDEHNSQVRAKGHVKDKVPAMANQLSDNGKGQQVPASARALPNGKYEIKDGCTRYLGHLRAGNSEVWVSTFQDRYLLWTEKDWDDWQSIYNDHPLTSPNTDDDIKLQIQKRLLSGRFTEEVGFKYETGPSLWLESAVTHIMSLYQNSGHRQDWFKNRIKAALKGEITSLAKNYVKASKGPDSALSSFKTLNSIGWRPEKATTASSSNGWIVYELDGKSRLFPNTFGNAGKKKIDKCQDKFALCAWIGDLAGKSDEDILKERAEIIESVKKINSEFPGYFNHLSFLPQIKNGANKDNFEKLVEVELD
tara:strand:+ start:14605 stop:15615 length:1011 start_codon:yes stop_codon:yes gene_type:complete